MRRPIWHAEHGQRLEACGFAQETRQECSQRAIQKDTKIAVSERELFGADPCEQRLAHQAWVRVAQCIEQTVAEYHEARGLPQLCTPLPKHFRPLERRKCLENRR